MTEKYTVFNGWLAEIVDGCTCVSPGDASVNGMHEPECGLEGIAPVEQLLDGSDLREQAAQEDRAVADWVERAWRDEHIVFPLSSGIYDVHISKRPGGAS